MLRRLQNTFNSAYVAPTTVSRKARQLTTQGSGRSQHQSEQTRRERDRRCNRDRRQGRHAVLIDLRSPYTRRKSGRRSQEGLYNASGIDVFA